jgi:hypothetical protein
MKRLALAIFLLGSSVAAAPAATESVYSRPRVGLSVRYPPGWAVVRRHLTPCTNPIQRMALRRKGALVLLMESLDPPRYAKRFPRRPERFRLRGDPQWLVCCEPLHERGWMLDFRDGGRAFYAYVYGSNRAVRAEAVAILDSLRVHPRPR